MAATSSRSVAAAAIFEKTNKRFLETAGASEKKSK